MIAGTSNARLGSFTLSTGATEGVNINTLTVALSSDESATITDLILKDNATGAQVGTTKSAPSTSNAFSVNVSMGASVTKTIDIYANVKSGSNAGSWIANIDASELVQSLEARLTQTHLTFRRLLSVHPSSRRRPAYRLTIRTSSRALRW